MPPLQKSPPVVTLDGTEVTPTFLDWAGSDASMVMSDPEQAPDLDSLPRVNRVNGNSLTITIQAITEPLDAEFSLFRGALQDIDPWGPPNFSRVIPPECWNETEKGLFTCTLEDIPEGAGMGGVNIQYYASPESGDRFTNYGTWIAVFP